MSQDFTDDEDEKDIHMQLEKENKEKVIYDDEQIKDYGMLFGLKEDEVQAMKSQIESLKDENILFGEPEKVEASKLSQPSG